MKANHNKGGRPKKPPSEKKVKLSAMISPDLESAAKEFSAKHDISISNMLERGLRLLLEKIKARNPSE